MPCGTDRRPCGSIICEYLFVSEVRPVEVIEHFGIRLQIDPEFMSPKLMDVIREGRYETPEARRIARIIQPGDTVLEIGAGIGFMSALMLKNPDVDRLVSYEANPLLIDKIRHTVFDNGLSAADFDLRNGVLTSDGASGTVDFHIHRDFWASSLRRTPATIRSVPVPLDDFNAVIRQVKPTVVVCDIEGGERALFSRADLTGIRSVYIELHQRVFGGAGMRDVFQAFHEQGFHYDQTHSQGAVVLFSRVV
jgi:FkbM family methyltransferase